MIPHADLRHSLLPTCDLFATQQRVLLVLTSFLSSFCPSLDSSPFLPSFLRKKIDTTIFYGVTTCTCSYVADVFWCIWRIIAQLSKSRGHTSHDSGPNQVQALCTVLYENPITVQSRKPSCQATRLALLIVHLGRTAIG